MEIADDEATNEKPELDADADSPVAAELPVALEKDENAGAEEARKGEDTAGEETAPELEPELVPVRNENAGADEAKLAAAKENVGVDGVELAIDVAGRVKADVCGKELALENENDGAEEAELDAVGNDNVDGEEDAKLAATVGDPNKVGKEAVVEADKDDGNEPIAEEEEALKKGEEENGELLEGVPKRPEPDCVVAEPKGLELDEKAEGPNELAVLKPNPNGFVWAETAADPNALAVFRPVTKRLVWAASELVAKDPINVDPTNGDEAAAEEPNVEVPKGDELLALAAVGADELAPRKPEEKIEPEAEDPNKGEVVEGAAAVELEAAKPKEGVGDAADVPKPKEMAAEEDDVVEAELGLENENPKGEVDSAAVEEALGFVERGNRGEGEAEANGEEEADEEEENGEEEELVENENPVPAIVGG